MASAPHGRPWYQRFDTIYLYTLRWVVLAADTGFIVKVALDDRWQWSALGAGGGLALARSLKRDADR